METIDLDINEENELAFKLKIDGVASGAVSARLYCESEDGVMHAFSGQFRGDSDTVTFRMPQMGKLMTEGVYPAWIEVVIDNKQFVPANFSFKFKKPISVQVESVSDPVRRQAPAAVPAVQVESVSRVSKPAPAAPAAPTGRTRTNLKTWYKGQGSK